MIQTVPQVRNRHLVREIDRGRVRELVVVVGLASLLLVPLLLYVWNHMEWIRVGFELERLEKERLSQAELGERLRVEKASLASLPRVESQARRRLGLAPAAPVLRLVEEPEKAAPSPEPPRPVPPGRTGLQPAAGPPHGGGGRAAGHGTLLK